VLSDVIRPLPSSHPPSLGVVKLSREMPHPSGRSTISYPSTFVPKSSPSIERAQEASQSHDRRSLPSWKTPSRSIHLHLGHCEVWWHRCEQAPVHHGHLHRQAARRWFWYSGPPSNVFSYGLCLWDTGTQTSYVLSSSLSPEIRGGQQSGTAFMDIKCESVSVW